MRTTTLLLTAAVSAAGLAAMAGPADACNCRVRYHHVVYRHAAYYRHAYRPYTYSYATPAYYYDDYGYDPYVYRSYYDWSYAPGVWVGYGGYGGWRRHYHRHGEWAGGRGHWHEGGHGHWDHGRHGD
jgi:hypothetical protein